MNREFEFKQLLRAYRGGIISEAAFEQEMARLEAGGASEANGVNGGGFRAFGRTYKSERAAVVSFIDKVCAAEANGAEAFPRWAEVSKTEYSTVKAHHACAALNAAAPAVAARQSAPAKAARAS
jgi:hypothetical protein